MNEKWREVYTEEQIKNIQKIELLNLKELERVCSKIGIQFFLYGGSLIGAVRHKGFVPWDDDLDIAMLRDDYEKFIKEAPRYLSDEYYLQTPYNDKKSPYYYTKLRVRGTKCVEYGTHKMNIEHGIYVDIYPIDNMPETNEEYLRNHSKFQKIIRLFVLRQCPYRIAPGDTLKHKIKALIKYGIALALRIVPHKVYISKLDKIMKSSNGTKTSKFGNYSYPEPTNLFREITPFEKGEFEGFEINLPKDWHGHLTMRYGDYMKMPPVEKRLGHKPYVLDFGKYKEE